MWLQLRIPLLAEMGRESWALETQEVVPMEVLLMVLDRELAIIEARRHQLLHVKRLQEKDMNLLDDKISYVSAV